MDQKFYKSAKVRYSGLCYVVERLGETGDMQHTHEDGNILFTSLLVLLIMNLLGLGLVQGSVREAGFASFKTIDSEVFHFTESCSQDVVVWFEGQTATPSSLPDFTQANLNFLMSGNETDEMLNKLNNYSYNCNVNYLITKTDDSNGATVGEEIGNMGGEYSSDAALTPKDYYQITAIGAGPSNATKTTNTVISVEY